MASYAETKDRLMKYYPELFPTEKHVLFHLFFVAGTGYHWQNGELVSVYQEDVELVFARRKEATQELVSLCREALGEVAAAEVIKILNEPNGPEKGMYPLWEGSHIVQLPDDIKPDWFEAATKAVVFADTLETTKNDRDWLFCAKTRLLDLAPIGW